MVDVHFAFLAVSIVSDGRRSDETHLGRALGACDLRAVYPRGFLRQRLDDGAHRSLEDSIDTVRTGVFDLQEERTVDSRGDERRLLRVRGEELLASVPRHMCTAGRTALRRREEKQLPILDLLSTASTEILRT